MLNPLDRENRSKAQKKSFQENPERRLHSKKAYELGLKVWRENNPCPALGKSPWNKGMSTTEENKAKLRKPKTRTQKMLAAINARNERNKLNPTMKGRKHTPEAIAKIKASQEAKKIAIMCNETGEKFSSIAEAAKALNLSRGNIASCVKGTRKSVKNFTFTKL